MNFFKRSIIIPLALIFAFKCNNPIPHSGVVVNEKISGLSVAAGPQLFDSLDVVYWKSLNATWVCFMPYAFVDEQSGDLIFNSNKQWKGETTQGIIHSIELAKKNGLHVFIKPQLWLTYGKYTGDLAFDGKSWERFWKGYNTFLLDYLTVADSLNCDLFSIGTELHQLVSNHEKDWLEFIQKLSTFKTPLTYSENWDVYHKISFWNRLDYIGVNAYFPVSEEKNCSFENTNESWNETLIELERASAIHEKPVLFTEFGYRSIDYCGKEPWKFDHEDHPNQQSQANCLNALFKHCWDKPWFAGGFLWKEYGHLHPEETAVETDFTISGKLAEGVIKTYYTKHRN